MKWQCQVYDTDGIQCSNTATARIHFSHDHPFHHTDVCEEHIHEFESYSWIQFHLEEYGEYE